MPNHLKKVGCYSLLLTLETGFSSGHFDKKL